MQYPGLTSDFRGEKPKSNHLTIEKAFVGGYWQFGQTPFQHTGQTQPVYSKLRYVNTKLQCVLTHKTSVLISTALKTTILNCYFCSAKASFLLWMIETYLCALLHTCLQIQTCRGVVPNNTLWMDKLEWIRHLVRTDHGRVVNPFQPRDAIWHHAFHLFLICMPFAHWFQ